MVSLIFISVALLCTLQNVLAFSVCEHTGFYIDVVNSQKDAKPNSCRCPSVKAAICNCNYEGVKYVLEAPFAAMLVEPTNPAPATWPPVNPYGEIDPRLPRLTGLEEPLNLLKMMPRPLKEIGAKFAFAYSSPTKEIKGNFYFTHKDFNEWDRNLNTTVRKVYVLIHGWTSTYSDVDMQSFTREIILRKESMPPTVVIRVDWGKAASGTYKQSAVDMVVVGSQLGLLLFELVKAKKFEASNVHIIGIDMGSHLAMVATEVFGKLSKRFNTRWHAHKVGDHIGRRTGLNPLARYFQDVLTPDPIYDALFVDNIHTATALSGTPGGSDDDILHRQYGETTLSEYTFRRQADFYPNGGTAGAFCKPFEYGCDLNLAVSIFRSTLVDNYNRYAYTSYLCSSYRSLQRCSKSHDVTKTNVMGIDAYPGGSYGNYFLTFNFPPPLSSSNITKSSSACPRSSKIIQYQPNNYQPDLQYETQDCGIFTPNLNRPVDRAMQGLIPGPKQYPWTVCILSAPSFYLDEDFERMNDLREPNPMKKIQRHFQKTDTDGLPPGSPYRKVYRWQQICTGSILNENWVLTAGHCFNRIKNTLPIYLVFAADDCQIPIANKVEQTMRIIVERRDTEPDQTIFTPGYIPPLDNAPWNAPKYNAFDMALIRLNKPIAISQDKPFNSVCWVGAQTFQYSHCRELEYSGYGSKGPGLDHDMTLTYLKLSIFRGVIQNLPDPYDNVLVKMLESDLERNEEIVYSANFEDTSYAGVGRSACGGDSGGPIVFLHPGGRALQVATHTRGPPCPGVKYITRAQYDPSLQFRWVPTGNPYYPWTQVPAGHEWVWLISVGIGNTVKRHVDFIKQTMDRYTGNPQPHDRFFGGPGHLGTSPPFNDPYNKPVTVEPPKETVVLLPPVG